MSRSRDTFVCQACGAVYPRWLGKCEACGGWNTIVQEAAPAPVPGGGAVKAGRGRGVQLESLAGTSPDAPRLASGIGELDRVTGGGFVEGSVLLLGGDPGIGKSTLTLQAAAQLAQAGHSIVYVTGEEASAQVRLRAGRLDLAQAPVMLAAETSLEAILGTLKTLAARGTVPKLLVIDSIQTLWTEAVDSAPGTVTQVRAAAQGLIRYAKATGCCVLLIGHVTKDGQIAGPRVVEHMVDAVLSFEGDASRDLRVLRAQKNRFGATDEIGVFAMTGKGLAEVPNPSELFLGDRDATAPGTAVFAGIEGSRPILVEIQALVSPTTLGNARRAVVGWDTSRLAMVLAVLDARAGLRLGAHDVYLNIAGGLRINEPAADLAVAAALASAAAGTPLPSDSVFFGEASLSGAVRAVVHHGARLKEAARLGFGSAIVPRAAAEAAGENGLKALPVGSLDDLVAMFSARPREARPLRAR